MESEVRLFCMSHSPVFGHKDAMPVPEEEQIINVYDELSVDIRKFDPELVVIFGPDHFNAFDYRVMPPFCVGLKGEGAGDYEGPAGAINIDTAAGQSCHAALAANNFDVAVSYRMRLDHGYTQPLSKLFGRVDHPPVVPIFINCAAPPLPPMNRVRQLGAAVGIWIAGLGKRTLVLGSGGISHDPPTPAIDVATPEQFDFLVNGSSFPRPVRKAREEKMFGAVRAFVSGRSELRALNPEWDKWVIDKLVNGSFAEICALTDVAIRDAGGRGGQEIRTWLAAFSALATSGEYRAKVHFYKPIPAWLTGIGIVSAESKRIE